jgi:hypothetical protein
MAIRQAVRRAHALFSMLYGGIHNRLLRTKHLEETEAWFIEERGALDGTMAKQVKLSVSSNTTDDTNYCYGGMKELFQLRKEDRKLSRSDNEDRAMGRKSWRRNSNTLDMFEDIADQMGRIAIQDEIDTLTQLLPITALRDDIKTYYDGWIAKLQGMCAVIEGEVGRSIVEMVPSPILRESPREEVQGLWGIPPQSICVVIEWLLHFFI